MAFLLETPFPYLLVSASLQLLALWLPPFRGRAVIFVPLIVLSAAAIYWPWENAFATDGARQRTYECYTFWVSTITTLEKLLFSTPEQSYWRVSKNIKREDVSSYGFGLKKLGWAFDLFANSRLIGWNQPVKGIVPVNMDKYHSKKWYLWVHFLEFVKLSLVLDLLYHFIRVQPTFKRMFLLENDGVSLADGPVVERFFTLWAFGISFCCIVKRVWVQGVLLGVGLGINDPKDWPQLYGFLGEVVTVRKFWGSFWHQWIRKAFTAYGLFFVRTLGMRRGSKLSSYTQLYVAFIISGIGHAISIAYYPFREGVPADSSHYIGTLWFFVAQALAITFEDIAIGIYNRQKRVVLSDGTRKVIGYVWVIFWFYYSLPWALDEHLNKGLGYRPLPISVVKIAKNYFRSA